MELFKYKKPSREIRNVNLGHNLGPAVGHVVVVVVVVVVYCAYNMPTTGFATYLLQCI